MDEPAVDIKVDVTQVKELEIPWGTFPASYPSSDFRVYVRPEAHDHMLQHSQTNTSIELCGMLIGEVLKDDFGPFVIVDEMVEGEHADGSSAGVTFTQDTWAHIFRELDVNHPGKRIIGWYHTHPVFGIFLSSMDTFIHGNFFNLPWQIAYVVDPLARTEGIFEWRNGRTAPSAPYWVGDVPKVGNQERVSQSTRNGHDHDRGRLAGESDEQTNMLEEPRRSSAQPWITYTAWHVIQITLLLLILLMVLSEGQLEEFIKKLFLLWST